MIEEEYVSFKTAKLANEKGFDEKTNSFYVTVEGGDTYLCFTAVHSWMKDTYNNSELEELNSKCDERYLAAPTQSLLARWLREKHDISVAAYRTWAMDNSYNYEILVGTDFEKMIREECECDRTYEEAMEAGLQEALKLYY